MINCAELIKFQKYVMDINKYEYARYGWNGWKNKYLLCLPVWI